MKNRLIIIIGIIILLGSIVSADLIMPGTKDVSYCAKIDNIDDFPDYTILAYNDQKVGGSENIFMKLKQDKCIYFGYKFNMVKLYAVKNSDIDIIKSIEDMNLSQGYLEPIIESSSDFIIPLNVDFKRRTSTGTWDPRSKVTEIFTLKMQGEDSFVVDKEVDADYVSFASFAYLLSLISLLIMLYIIKKKPEK